MLFFSLRYNSLLILFLLFFLPFDFLLYLFLYRQLLIHFWSIIHRSLTSMRCSCNTWSRLHLLRNCIIILFRWALHILLAWRLLLILSHLIRIHSQLEWVLPFTRVWCWWFLHRSRRSQLNLTILFFIILLSLLILPCLFSQRLKLLYLSAYHIILLVS